MQVEHLLYFYEISSGRTLAEVADKYHVSPSSMSKYISKLEESFNTELLTRSNNKLSLTPAGRQLFLDLQTLYPGYLRLLQNMSRYNRTQRVTVCYLPPLPDVLTESAINAFKSELPDCTFNNYVGHNMEDALEKLRAGIYDFVIAHHPFESLSDYSVAPLYSDKLVFLKSCQLCNKNYVTLKDLAQEKLTINGPLMSVYNSIKALLPVDPAIEQTTLSTLVLLNKVAEGHCSTLVFERSLKNIRIENVKVLPIEGLPEIPVILIFSKRRQLSLPQRKFIGMLEKECAANYTREISIQ